MFALMTIHTGELKLKNNESAYINNIEDGDLLTFKTKKEAIIYINSRLAWALKPIKIINKKGTWKGQKVNYRFY